MVAAAMADEGRVVTVAAMGTGTLWSANSGTLKHVRGHVLTAGEWVKQDPASRRLRCQGHGIPALAVSRRCHEPPLVSEAGGLLGNSTAWPAFAMSAVHKITSCACLLVAQASLNQTLTIQQCRRDRGRGLSTRGDAT